MSTPPLPPLVFLSDFTGSNHGVEILHSPDEARAAAFARLRATLADYVEAPGQAETWQEFRAARLVACDLVSRMPRHLSQTPEIHDLYELVREMAKSGVHDRAVEAEDLQAAQAFSEEDWRGVLAAMLLVPAWQWTAAPSVLQVPAWLRPDFVRWLFAAPAAFHSAAQAEVYAAYLLKRLEELVRWMKRGPEGKEELRVLAAYASRSTLAPLYHGPCELRRHAQLRGQLLGRAMAVRGDRFSRPAAPRSNRRLRVGIIHRHFCPNTETFATLPLFEQLDPARFEVILFAYVSDFNRVEDYCRQRAASLLALPSDIADQLVLLRNVELDVALFSCNLTADCNVVTRLALHRVAPLQVVTSSSCVTTGLPEIDLFLTGENAIAATDSAQFTERLGVMPGASHAFDFSADGEVPQPACTRADFGLNEGEFVFVSTADYRAITLETQQVWARLLATVPDSRLLVHPFRAGQASGLAIHQFNAGFEAVLKAEGVDPSRLALSCVDFPARTDVKSLVGLGDVYLDARDFSAAESLIDALETGLPVVSWAGSTLRARAGASLLRTLTMEGLVATTATEYQAIATRLATDIVFRKTCRTLIEANLQPVPAFLDPQQASERFGGLMERAFDELIALGRTGFRTNPLPVGLARA